MCYFQCCDKVCFCDSLPHKGFAACDTLSFVLSLLNCCFFCVFFFLVDWTLRLTVLLDAALSAGHQAACSQRVMQNPVLTPA